LGACCSTPNSTCVNVSVTYHCINGLWGQYIIANTGGTAPIAAGGATSGGTATGGIGTGGVAGAHTGGAGSCLPRDDDPTGYLVKICQYLLAHSATIHVGVDPNGYHIESIEQRTEAGRDVLWVRLDCCFTGDIAFIDPATGEVIGFSLGDV
jgi:hypothetical protein